MSEIVNEIQAPDPQLSLIQTEIKAISEMESKLKENRDMYNDHFRHNATYIQHSDRVAEASKARTSVKREIDKMPEVASLKQQLKDLRFDLTERKKTLSALLQDYHTKTGSTQLPLLDGLVGDIILSAKIVKAKRK